MPIGVIAAGVGAVGAIGGALISSSASHDAANVAQNAANQNNALQKQIYNNNVALEQPYVTRGNAAGTAYNALLGLGSPANPPIQLPGGGSGVGLPGNETHTPVTDPMGAYNTFLNSDGYQFRMDQGLKALNTGYAANGLIQSGAAMKGINSFAQGVASDEFGKYLGYLGNQQGVGLSATNALAGVGTNYANAVSANNNSAATAAGNAALTSANSVNGAIGNIANAIGLYSGMQSSYNRPNSAVAYGAMG